MNKGVNLLWDLSTWEGNKWIGWDLGDLPPELEAEADTLTNLLQGKYPIKEGTRDKRGWGNNTGNYTSTEGYKNIHAIPYAAPNSVVWKFLWSKPFIPKIDIFCQTLAHRSILSGENLKKRGMEGPSRCPLCKNEEETTDHLLPGCPFSKEVWNETMMLNLGVILQEPSMACSLNG